MWGKRLTLLSCALSAATGFTSGPINSRLLSTDISSKHFFHINNPHRSIRSSQYSASFRLSLSTSSYLDSLSRSSSSSVSSKDQVKTVFATTAASTVSLVVLDVMFRRLLKALSISFPSSLAGCISLFIVLLTLYNANSHWGDNVYSIFSPGAAVLAKWLPVFFVPSLVTLPLAPSLGSTTEVSSFV